MNSDQKNAYTFYDFFPLIAILTFIISLTLISQIYRGFSYSSAMYDFMGFFFLIFSIFKIFNWNNFVEAYRVYDIIAKRSKSYAYVYPLIELSLGLAYLFRWNLRLINPVTVIIMLISAVGVANELLAGKQIVCACLGVVFKIPMTWVTLLEDLLMAAMALLMMFW